MDTPWIGEGSIKLVESGKRKGKWRLQWTIVVGDETQKVDRSFERKADAVKWRDDKKVELRTGARVEAVKVRARSGLTLQGMFDELAGTRAKEFRDGIWVKNGASPQTVVTKLHRWSKHVAPSPLAARPVRLLARDDARGFVDEMKAKGAAIQTITDVMGVLKKVVFDAIDEKPECKTLANPFVRIALQTAEEKALAAKERAEREATEGPKLLTLSPDEARDGLAKATEPAHRAILALHLLGGLRSGERMALCVEQIDFERGVIVVDRAVRLGATRRQYVSLPKKDKIRLVAMCPTLAAILREHIAALPAGRTHLFGQERKDKPEMVYRANILWDEAVKAAGLPERLVPKGGRASHNNWVEKLCPAVSTSTRLEHMGHSLNRGDGQPSGLAVNIKNYTAHVPEAYDILRAEIERVIGFSAAVPRCARSNGAALRTKSKSIRRTREELQARERR